MQLSMAGVLLSGPVSAETKKTQAGGSAINVVYWYGARPSTVLVEAYAFDLLRGGGHSKLGVIEEAEARIRRLTEVVSKLVAALAKGGQLQASDLPRMLGDASPHSIEFVEEEEDR